jgi:hypothetical protein
LDMFYSVRLIQCPLKMKQIKEIDVLISIKANSLLTHACRQLLISKKTRIFLDMFRDFILLYLSVSHYI